MANAVAAVSKLRNFNGLKPSNLRQFKNFLSDLEYDYGDFLYHTEVRYLDTREVLKTVNDMERNLIISGNEEETFPQPFDHD